MAKRGHVLRDSQRSRHALVTEPHGNAEDQHVLVESRVVALSVGGMLLKVKLRVRYFQPADKLTR